MTRPDVRRWFAGTALWVALAVPPLRHASESAMTLQMLVQIPLLALCGWWQARAVPPGLARRLRAWNRSGISGLLLASVTGLVWMVPRMLDAALGDPWVELAKFLSVPLLIGMPVAASWPRAGFVVRGVVLSELIATTFRLGWLYRVAPVRLCSNYRLNDQQRLGSYLLAIGAVIVLVLAWKLMWGRVQVEPERRAGGRVAAVPLDLCRH